MGFLPKERIKQNLKKVDVFLEDTENEYIRVQDIPDTFVQGRSAFKLFGSEFLKVNVPLKIEILDKSGNTVWVEPVRYGQESSPKLPYRYVTVEVYPPPYNIPGEAEIVILAELDDEKVPFDIPQEFIGTYNVKYRKTINLDSSVTINTQPILFYKKPKIAATEIVKAQKKMDAPENTFISGSKLYGIVNAELSNQSYQSGSETNTQTNTSEGGKSSTSSGDIQKQANLWKYKTGEYASRSELEKRGIKKELGSPEVPQMVLYTNEANNFVSKMVGGDITVNNIDLPINEKREISNGDPTLPDSAFQAAFTFPTFVATVEEVISDRQLIVNKPYSLEFDSTRFGGDDDKQRIYSNIGSISGQSPIYANFTASYVDWSVPSTSSYRFDSFIDLTIENMRTFSGDVYRLKVYGASDSSQGDFPVLLNTVVESPELLVDTNSPSGVLRSGYFIDQTHIDKYWNAYGGDNTTNTLTPYYTMSLADSVFLSGSYSTYNQVGRAELDNSYSFTVRKDVVYTLSFKARARKTEKTDISGNAYKKAKMFFHLSGSNLARDVDLQIQHSASFGHTLTNEFNQKVGLEILDDVSDDEWIDFGYISHTFTPKFKLNKIKNTDTVLQLRIHSGEWVIRDISLRAASDTGFSPDEMKVRIPIPPNTLRPDNWDFLIEYLDINGNTAETITFLDNIAISGSALVIEGSDNLLSGSLFMGNIQDSGIEMAGANSAFMRSVGYIGFQSASLSGKGGFMIWSGSVLPDAPDNYTGAGLEIHDGVTGDDESYFKFRTNPSLFDVKTSTFFFGKSNNPANFISGSNGNLQISSSNFSVGASGNVTMSGEVSASSGHIGNFRIIDGKISGSNITLDATNSTIYKTDQGPGSDTSAPFDQLRDEYYIDFTPTVESPDNYYIKMGPNFMVDKDGILIASGATFEGSITASAGLIGGFTTDSHSFYSDNIFISGSPEVGGIDDPKYMFISTSNFNVKENGDITGSQVLFTGGKIAGFTIDGTQLKQGTSFYLDGNSSATYFISSSNFQVRPDGDVSGSQVLFTGGKIAGATITDDKLSYGSNWSISASAQDNEYFISSSKFNVKQSGDITGSQVLFTGGKIAGATISDTELKYGSNWSISSSAQPNEYFISSSKFNVKQSGDITGSQVLFTGGKIAGFTISGNTLTATNFTLDASGKSISLGTDDTIFIADADEGIQLGDATFADAPFSVTTAGVLKAESGTIGGWNIDNSKIYSTNLYIRSSGVLETANFASGVKGWRIDSANNGSAEFENVKIRGTLSTAVFEKETVNAVGGQLYIANSTAITGSGTVSASEATMSVENVGGFVANEIVSAKKIHNTGFATEYMLVESSSRDNPSSDTNFAGKLYVQRGYSGSLPGTNDTGSLGNAASIAQDFEPGQVLVSTGTVGTGYIRLNANPNDPYTPYIDIVERTGSAIYDVDLKARLGDLSGLSSARLHGTDPANAGFGLYSQNVFLEGGIVANTGSIAGINMESGKLYTGTGTHNNSNTGFYLDSGSKFSLGDKFSWDGNNLSVEGSITITSGDLAGVTAASISGSYPPASASQDNSFATQVVLDNDGMGLWNAAGTVQVADYGSTVTIGRSGSGYENVYIDSDSVDIRRGTQVSASFGIPTTIGPTTGEHIKISSTGVELKKSSTVYGKFASTTTIGNTSADHVSIDSNSVDVIHNSNNKAVVDATGFHVTQSANGVAHFGSTMRVGQDHASKSALRVDGSGNLTIGTSGTTNFSVTNAGAITMAAGLNAVHINATSGSIGGFTIGTNILTTSGAGIGKSGQDQAFWAGSDTQNSAEFRVSHAGALVASDATITGTITADIITANTAGNMAGFRLGSNILESTGSSAGVGVKIDTSTTNTINVGDFDAQHMLLDGANSNVKFYDASNNEILKIGSGLTQTFSGYGHGMKLTKGALLIYDGAAVQDQIAPSLDVQTERESNMEGDAYSVYFRMSANNSTSYNQYVWGDNDGSDFSTTHYNIYSKVTGLNYMATNTSYGVYSKVEGVGTSGTGYGGYFSAKQYNSVQPTNLYGLYVKAETADNTFGVYIDADSGFGLYVADGNSYFQGGVSIGNTTAQSSAGLTIGSNGGTMNSDGSISVTDEGLNIDATETGKYVAGIRNGSSGGHGLLIEAGQPGTSTHYPLKVQDRLSSGDLMVVSADGNVTISGDVGIGTTNPGYTLDVTGDIRVTDDLFVDDFARIDALRVGTTSTDPGDGNLYVEGNVIIGTSGKGIDFSAASGDASGMSHEILDDYEEGSWTATVNASGTATSDNTRYIKIGAQVTCWFRLYNIQESGTQTVNLEIGSLPFTVQYEVVGGTVMCHNIDFQDDPDNVNNLTCWVKTDETVRIYETKDGSGWSHLTWADLSDGDHIYGYFTYITAE